MRSVASDGWSAIVSRCNDLQNQYTATTKKIYFVHKDHIGSSIALTDASGSIVQEYAYDVYGSPYVKNGTGYIAIKDFSGNLHGNDRLFTGREYEKYINLYYYRARFYDPVNGRFISRDPIGMADDVNLYGYVRNRPVGFNDPDGKKAKEIISKILLGAVVYGELGIMTVQDTFNSDFDYGWKHYYNSLIGTKELKYYNESDFVKRFKNTQTFSDLKTEIEDNYLRNKPLNGSRGSEEIFSQYSLGLYNYTASGKKNGDNVDVAVQITDVYDFNYEKGDGLGAQILNLFHSAQEAGIITPYPVEINLNYSIPLGK